MPCGPISCLLYISSRNASNSSLIIYTNRTGCKQTISPEIIINKISLVVAVEWSSLRVLINPWRVLMMLSVRQRDVVVRAVGARHALQRDYWFAVSWRAV